MKAEAKVYPLGKLLDQRWTSMYSRLKSFHQKHGHSNVPRNWKEDRRLASWVKIQRGRKIKGTIPQKQIKLLNQLNFSWKLRERGTWERGLADLKLFKTTHGHCNVPKTYLGNPKLAMYARSLKVLHSQGKLPEGRLRILDELGFKWSSKKVFVKVGLLKVTRSWKENYESFLAFKAKHGHCNIPVRRHPYRAKLGQWVIWQRKGKLNGTLPPECQRLLERIGFKWNPEQPGL